MTYTKEQALAALAAAPDSFANGLGYVFDEKGKPVRPMTREDVHQGLLDGALEPEGVMWSLSFVRWSKSPGAERELVEAGARRRRKGFRIAGEGGGADVMAGHDVDPEAAAEYDASLAARGVAQPNLLIVKDGTDD